MWYLSVSRLHELNKIRSRSTYMFVVVELLCMMSELVLDLY